MECVRKHQDKSHLLLEVRILLLFHDHSLSGGGQGEGNQKIINLSTHGTFTHGRKNLRKAIRTEFTR